MESLGWRQRRGSSPAAQRGARERAGLTPVSASNILSCERETLTQSPIKKSLDSDHGIYRDLPLPASKCHRVIVVDESHEGSRPDENYHDRLGYRQERVPGLRDRRQREGRDQEATPAQQGVG